MGWCVCVDGGREVGVCVGGGGSVVLYSLLDIYMCIWTRLAILEVMYKASGSS